MLTQAAFLHKLQPFAVQAATLIGAPVYPAAAVILAQWDVESGRESDRWIAGNNYAGITDGAGGFLSFAAASDFVQVYVHTLLTTWGGSAYGGFVDACRGSDDAGHLVDMLAASPWDAGHYGETEGLPQGDLLMQRLQFYMDALKPAPDQQAPSLWAHDAWGWAKAGDINDGLDPHKPVTEEQVMTFLKRYHDRYGGGGA